MSSGSNARWIFVLFDRECSLQHYFYIYFSKINISNASILLTHNITALFPQFYLDPPKELPYCWLSLLQIFWRFFILKCMSSLAQRHNYSDHDLTMLFLKFSPPINSFLCVYTITKLPSSNRSMLFFLLSKVKCLSFC